MSVCCKTAKQEDVRCQNQHSRPCNHWQLRLREPLQPDHHLHEAWRNSSTIIFKAWRTEASRRGSSQQAIIFKAWRTETQRREIVSTSFNNWAWRTEALQQGSSQQSPIKYHV